jgi:RNA polymerase sigma factor (TIGR02999 family)
MKPLLGTPPLHGPRTFVPLRVASRCLSQRWIGEAARWKRPQGPVKLLEIPGPFSKGEPMSEVTRILSAVEQGEPHAAEQLLPLVYDELRKLAAQRLAQEKPGQTLQATALVHEAYLRLVDVERAQHWNSRGHFFAAAAEAIRRILIENARRRQAVKHGGGLRRINLDKEDALVAAPAEDLLALDEALDQLTRQDPRAAQVVRLHCFAGLTVEQAAEVLDLSRTNAYRLWTFARAWLHCQLDGSPGADS